MPKVIPDVPVNSKITDTNRKIVTAGMAPRRDVRVTVRFSAEEYDLIKNAANNDSRSVADLVRKLVVDGAKELS